MDSKKRKHKRYSEEEKQFLIDNYVEKGPKFCKENLNRSIESIYVHASKMKLRYRNKEKELRILQSIARERGGKCLSTEYINNRIKLKFQCRKKHIWEASPSHIKHSDTWCPECNNPKKYTLQFCKEVAEKHKGKCISISYVNITSKLKWKCQNGHIFEKSLYSILYQNTWCPFCSSLLGEEITRRVFEYLFDKPFPKKRPKWLIGPKGGRMELDGYNEELGIAFEYQGSQHYEKVWYLSEKEWKDLQERDQTKQKLCKKNKVTCVIINEFRRLDKTKSICNAVLKIIKQNKLSNYIKQQNMKEIDFSNVYNPHFNTLLGIVKNKKGKLLSTSYCGDNIKLKFQCQYGHIWETTPNNIKNGKWCRICGNNKTQKKRALSSFDKLEKIVRNKGGKILSKIKNEHGKLLFECAKKHKWYALQNNIIMGKWCPFCAGKRQTIEDYQKIAKERNGKCLSAEYISCKTKLKFQCEKGHVWEASPDNIKHGRWCPICAREKRRKKK